MLSMLDKTHSTAALRARSAGCTGVSPGCAEQIDAGELVRRGVTRTDPLLRNDHFPKFHQFQGPGDPVTECRRHRLDFTPGGPCPTTDLRTGRHPAETDQRPPPRNSHALSGPGGGVSAGKRRCRSRPAEMRGPVDVVRIVVRNEPELCLRRTLVRRGTNCSRWWQASGTQLFLNRVSQVRNPAGAPNQGHKAALSCRFAVRSVARGASQGSPESTLTHGFAASSKIASWRKSLRTSAPHPTLQGGHYPLASFPARVQNARRGRRLPCPPCQKDCPSPSRSSPKPR